MTILKFSNNKSGRILKSLSFPALFFAVLFLTPIQSAFAQGAVPVAKYRQVIVTNPFDEGRKGLQGQVGLFTGFDSNLTYGSGTVDSSQVRYEQIIPALSFKLDASVKYASANLSKRFDSKSTVEYGAELGLNFHQPYEWTTAPGVYNEPRLSGFLKGVLYWKPSRHLKFEAFEIANRNSRTHYLFKNDFVMSWITNTAGFIANIYPGDELLRMTLGYNMGLIYFEDSELSNDNRMSHNVDANISYRFLPKSTLWLAANYNIFQYLGDGSRNSMPLKVYGGVSTPLWLNLGLTLGGGYSWGFMGIMPSTWLATATLTYTLASKLKISLNYNHDFNDTLIGSYTDSHNFSLRTFVPLGQKLLFQGEVGFKMVNYNGLTAAVTAPGSPSTRSDSVISTKLQLMYRFSKQFTGTASYQFMMDQTPYRISGINSTRAGGIVDNDPSFMKHEIYLSLQYFF